MSAEQQQGLTYEEAIAADPVGFIYVCQTVQNNLAPAMMEHIALGTPETVAGTRAVYREEVVNTLKSKIAELEDQLRNHEIALANRQTELEAERSNKFSEAGWFLPKEMVTDNVGISLDHLINKAKRTSVVNVVVAPGEPYEIIYEADWVKYLRKVEPQAAQTWIVKLGSAVAHLHEPSLISRVSASKQEETIKRLMNDLGSPNSTSLAQAFKQFANEICYGHVSLETVVQKVAGTYTGKLRVEEPMDTSHYCNPYAVPADRINTGSPISTPEVVCTNSPSCCTRNRPLSEQGNCRLKPSIVNAAPEQVKVHTDLGVPDVSSVKEFTCAECPNQAVLEGCCGRNTKEYPQSTERIIENLARLPADATPQQLAAAVRATKPVYAVSALTDPTTIQKAVVMGLVGTAEQQAEAREFLTQYIQLVKDYPATMSTAMQRQ